MSASRVRKMPGNVNFVRMRDISVVVKDVWFRKVGLTNILVALHWGLFALKAGREAITTCS